MKVISLNVGLPREIFHEGRKVRTGIFKQPVAARVHDRLAKATAKRCDTIRGRKTRKDMFTGGSKTI
jgi:MOSC domain-containing protein YiiM